MENLSRPQHQLHERAMSALGWDILDRGRFDLERVAALSR